MRHTGQRQLLYGIRGNPFKSCFETDTMKGRCGGVVRACGHLVMLGHQCAEAYAERTVPLH